MIRLQFSAEADASSRIIEFYDHGDYSHVDVILPDGKLLGARLDGVKIREPGYASFTRTLIVELPCSPEVETAFYDFVRAQIGKPYDKLAIAAFAAGTNWTTPGHWFCSQMIVAGLLAAKFFVFPLSVPSNKIAPDDLVLILSAMVRIKLAA